MTGPQTRYPGAQPFADDDLARKVFFGREEASVALTNQILANRMVVVYAKSGLGKSSLLNAGVAQRLRDEGYLPLIVRVNDIERGPFVSVVEGIQAAAERQKVEYVAGKPNSLWTFFKTVEFWRGDLLLTPVLILDQFEELFTLQDPEARTAFIADLGHLVRGIRPPSATATDADLSETPPALRVVLSLREDYLGFLEEAADRIPQILDHRFRLTPLSVEAAAEAMTGPAGIDDPAFQTRPFRYDPETVATILDYLSQRRTRAVAEKAAYVEPFQLQLICQRVETIAASRQPGTQTDLTITMQDIGGEAALKRMLKDFYARAVGALPKRRVRRAVRRLCEDYLISPEGRRLSLEEHEIRRQLKVPRKTLRYLVDSRLLRSDNRSDSTYYELSHDALVEPVLDTRRAKGTAAGWLSVVSGSVLFAMAGVSFGLTMFFLILIDLYGDTPPAWYAEPDSELWSAAYRIHNPADYLAVMALAVLWLYGASLVRRGLRAIRRYGRLTSIQLEPTTHRAKKKAMGWLGLISGPIMVAFSILYLIAIFPTRINPLFSGTMPKSLTGSAAHTWQSVHDYGLRLDSIALIVTVLALFLFGRELLVGGVRRLLGLAPRLPAELGRALLERRPFKDLALGSAGLIAGLLAFLAAAYWVGWIVSSVECAYHSGGQLPGWPSENWLNGFNAWTDDCRSRFETPFKFSDIFEFMFAAILSVYGARCLRRGFRMIRGHLRRRTRALAAG